MAAMASLRRFLSPAFYQAAATDFGAMVRTKYIQGNILAQPITGFMVTIGAVGYFIEYSVLGRYHVAHKKEKKMHDESPLQDGCIMCVFRSFIKPNN